MSKPALRVLSRSAWPSSGGLRQAFAYRRAHAAGRLRVLPRHQAAVHRHLGVPVRGRLVELLPELAGRTRPFSLVCASHRHQSAAARALTSALGQVVI